MSENCFSASASRPPTTVCSVRSVGSAISSSLLTSSRGMRTVSTASLSTIWSLAVPVLPLYAITALYVPGSS